MGKGFDFVMVWVFVGFGFLVVFLVFLFMANTFVAEDLFLARREIIVVPWQPELGGKLPKWSDSNISESIQID